MARPKQDPEFGLAALDALIGDTRTPEELAACLCAAQQRSLHRM